MFYPRRADRGPQAQRSVDAEAILRGMVPVQPRIERRPEEEQAMRPKIDAQPGLRLSCAFCQFIQGRPCARMQTAAGFRGYSI